MLPEAPVRHGFLCRRLRRSGVCERKRPGCGRRFTQRDRIGTAGGSAQCGRRFGPPARALAGRDIRAGALSFRGRMWNRGFRCVLSGNVLQRLPARTPFGGEFVERRFSRGSATRGRNRDRNAGRRGIRRFSRCGGRLPVGVFGRAASRGWPACFHVGHGHIPLRALGLRAGTSGLAQPATDFPAPAA